MHASSSFPSSHGSDASWVVADATAAAAPASPEASRSGRDALAHLVGSSALMTRLRTRIARAARTHASVLVQGESGTGKELVANAIHALSERSHQPLVVIQCGTIPDAIAASELFGHERGAFTDARAPRRGRFECAHKGTAFLDEVGDLSPLVQVQLLRTLQFGEISRVGADHTHKVDVRVVAATHRPLEQMVADGRFRQDLYWRLHELPIQVPALRERAEDVPELLSTFLDRANLRYGRAVPGVTDDAMRALLAHSWPGNVRELDHRVRRAVIESECDVPLGVRAFDLPDAGAANAPDGSRLGAILVETESEMVARALAVCSGNRTRTALALGISRRTLQKKLARFGIR
ncbi:MAG: sigma 54-interacting transcriptional regulator [Deltaproteobacteria bacterium]|nr:sigma 54-interacting transcriptional regulator [Deltaproteobacteria bacterium]